MSNYVGRDIVLSYGIAAVDATPVSVTYARLGMMRTKGLSIDWDSVNTTGDTSPDYTKTMLATFKSVKFEGDGVVDTAVAQNQLDFESAVFSPTVTTDYQPIVWLKLEYPDKTFTGPFLVNNLKLDGNYDAEATFSFSAESTGEIVRAEV